MLRISYQNPPLRCTPVKMSLHLGFLIKIVKFEMNDYSLKNNEIHTALLEQIFASKTNFLGSLLTGAMSFSAQIFLLCGK